MEVDLGVNNLMAEAINSDKTPFIINGRPLKSINQYYNKKGLIYRVFLKKAIKNTVLQKLIH